MKWQERVYKQSEENDPDWEKVRSAVFWRDGYTCFRCGRYRRAITVHHIIPRSEGGTNNEANLITLCVKCHDKIELEECRSLGEIRRSYIWEKIQASENEAVRKRTGKRKKKKGGDGDVDYSDWHVIVYGAGRPSQSD